ncbi:DUF2891 domain-containing protein [Sphingomonas sp. GCM10030256]|uniref:DUF2891 domain-containing protein n=1 Tax=Sphingomonas sp. GCM10030256 TaxID=3273427 RepID=UPI0036162ACF
MSVPPLDAEWAGRFARIALSHVGQEYPHKLDHVLLGDEDARPPRELHPIFFGSFDWHSCVHGWWTLLTIRRRFPDLPEAAAIADLADGSFTPAKVAVELAYLDRPQSGGFERPYGWAWLLALHGEAERHGGQSWGRALDPLACAFAERFKSYLSKLTYPITVGTHFNTAFALTLAHEWAMDRDAELLRIVEEWTERVFGPEREYRGWEPGGDEFLSPGLSVALLMSRVREPEGFTSWFEGFLLDGGAVNRFTPAFVSDRSDGKIAHLDGLNLSRAWALRAIARKIAPNPGQRRLEQLADEHLSAALPHIVGDYAGEHWLATFALLALLAGEPTPGRDSA